MIHPLPNSYKDLLLCIYMLYVLIVKKNYQPLFFTKYQVLFCKIS